MNAVGALQELALAHMHRGEYDLALSEMDDALTLSREAEGSMPDGPQVVSVIHANLAQVALAAGHAALAMPHVEEAVRRQRGLGYTWALGDTLRILGDVALERGEPGRALAAYRESAELTRDHGDLRFLANALAGIANLHALHGDREHAARLYAATGALHEQIGAGIELWQRSRHERAIAQVQADLSPSTFAASWETGRSCPLDETIAAALATPFPPEPVSPTPLPPPPAPGMADGLTARELQVLRLLTEGRTDREIGQILFISTRTASYHVTNLLSKLGLDSRTAAAAYAVRSGLG